MKIKQQFIFCGNFSSSMMKVHHQLVIPFHIIHLKTFDSHFRIILAYTFHIPIERIVACPKNKSHIPFFSISDKFRQIKFWNNLKQIRLIFRRPAIVQKDILYTIPGCEINVTFVSLIINTCFKINSQQVPCMPPLPCRFSGFHP